MKIKRARQIATLGLVGVALTEIVDGCRAPLASTTTIGSVKSK